MEIQKFVDFILNEARTNKKEVTQELLDMFKNKPHVEMDNLANERGLYSLSGMKRYLSKYSSMAVDQALGDLQNQKDTDLESVYVRVEKWSKSMPYYYMGLTKAQVSKLKSEYEEEEKKKNEKEIDSKVKSQKSAVAASAAKEEAKKSAQEARKKTTAKKSSGQGVERKSGQAPKRKTTRKTK
jgi:hypothetical protein